MHGPQTGSFFSRMAVFSQGLTVHTVLFTWHFEHTSWPHTLQAFLPEPSSPKLLVQIPQWLEALAAAELFRLCASVMESKLLPLELHELHVSMLMRADFLRRRHTSFFISAHSISCEKDSHWLAIEFIEMAESTVSSSWKSKKPCT